MLRIVALVFIALAVGIGYETVTGNEIGISAALRSLGAIATEFTNGKSSPSLGATGGALGG